ncbi:protein-tyrosine phosphatase-like protein [Chytridium lagenaria]|nr:protein-tyrosine phosphatase-like protein [Chytridium lagenaria]
MRDLTPLWTILFSFKNSSKSKMDKVDDRIFISDLPSSISPLLQTNSITHILSLGWHPTDPTLPTHLPPLFHLALPINDDESDPTALLRVLPDALAFIDDAVEKGVVLVHCVEGVSRSAAVVVAWGMRKWGTSVEEAVSKVKEARGLIDPNPSFIRQLQTPLSTLTQGKRRLSL